MHKFLLAKNPNVADSETFIIHCLSPLGVIQVVRPGEKVVLSKIQATEDFPAGSEVIQLAAHFSETIDPVAASKVLKRAYHWYISNENK